MDLTKINAALQNIIDSFEPQAVAVSAEADAVGASFPENGVALFSIAISLKRIADAQTK